MAEKFLKNRYPLSKVGGGGGGGVGATFFFKKEIKKLYGLFFYGWGSTVSRLETLRGGSLLFTTKFPEIPSTHFIDLGRMKNRVDLEA